MSELKKKALQGIRWTTLSAIVTASGGLVQALLLTRLIDKSAFGLMAIVNVVLGLSVQLVDMGFSNALLREHDPTKAQLNSLFWLNVSMGLLLGLVVCAIAMPMASIYAEADLRLLLWAISPAFLLSGISMLYQTLLQKKMLFQQMATIEISAFVGSFLVTLLLAFYGYGPFALVGGALVKTGMGALLYYASGRRLHRLSFHFKWTDIKPMWQFGYYQSIEKLLNYGNLNFENLIIGKVLGKEALGVYDVVKRLLLQPMYVINPIITKVSYPIMMQVRDDTPRLRNIALRAMQLVAVINAPIYLASFIGAGLIVPVLLGWQWSMGVEPFRWLALCFLLRTLINPLGGVLLAKGKIKYGIYLQLAIFGGLCLSVGFGLKYGLVGMLQVLLGFYGFYVTAFFYFLIKPLIKARVPEVFQFIRLELMLAFVTFGTASVLTWYLSKGWLALFGYGLMGGISYTLLLFYFKPGLRTELKQILNKSQRP